MQDHPYLFVDIFDLNEVNFQCFTSRISWRTLKGWRRTKSTCSCKRLSFSNWIC